MAAGAPHKCVLTLVEILNYSGMTVHTFEYNRMVADIFVALFRTLAVTIFAFKNGRMDPGLTDWGEQI